MSPSPNDSSSDTQERVFDVMAFHGATGALERAKDRLQSTVRSRKLAALRHLLPNAKGFSWDFDEDAWTNDQLVLPGTVYLNVDDTRHTLGEFELHGRDPSVLGAIRPHVRDGLKDEEIAIIVDWIVELLLEFEGDRYTQAWEFEAIETMRSWDLGLPDLSSLLGSWSSPTVPFGPAPTKPTKNATKRATKKAPRA